MRYFKVQHLLASRMKVPSNDFFGNMLELHYNLSKECCVLQLTQPAGMHWWLDTSSCCYIQVAVRWMAFGVNIHTTKREEKETSREGRNLTKTGFHSYFLFLSHVLQYKVIYYYTMIARKLKLLLNLRRANYIWEKWFYMIVPS